MRHFFCNDQAVSTGCVLGRPGLPDYRITSRYDDNIKMLFLEVCDVLICKVAVLTVAQWLVLYTIDQKACLGVFVLHS